MIRTGAGGRHQGLRLLRFLLVPALALVVVMALFPTLANRMIFYPDREVSADPSVVGLAFEDVYFPADEDGVRLHGWFVAPETDRPLAVLLFLHGNAGNISHRLENVAGLVESGLAVFIFDYRGYGKSDGRPSEKGTYRDALGAWRWLSARPDVNKNRIVVFGRSLGGAVAVDLAVRVRPAALILESTFTSVRDMADVHFQILPRFLVPRMYESLAKIGDVKSPTLFVHGKMDDLVPFPLGQRLYEAHPGPKEFLAIPAAGHNDTFIIGGEDYYRRLTDFISRSLGDPE